MIVLCSRVISTLLMFLATIHIRRHPRYFTSTMADFKHSLLEYLSKSNIKLTKPIP